MGKSITIFDFFFKR